LKTNTSKPKQNKTKTKQNKTKQNKTKQNNNKQLVHFVNTALLIDKLNEIGKPYVLNVFPAERHGIRNPKNSIVHEANLIAHWSRL